jgi:beta-catenin-like protein 1
MARLRAIKVLDYALQTEDGTDNCVKFVEALGLKSLFSAFMGRVGWLI